MAQEIYPIKVTEIGEFIRHKLCERRVKLAYHSEEEASKVPFAVRILNPIDPILQASGQEKEGELAQELLQAGFRHITENYYIPDAHPAGHPTWANFVQALTNVREGERAFAREVSLEGNIGRFPIQGRLDFIMLLWVENRPVLRIVEAKASHKDRTYHKIQVTLYRMIIEQLIANNSLSINGQQITKENIECVVIRIDETQNRMQSILQTAPIADLSQEETDILHLLADNGPFMRIITTPIDQLDYKLDLKCDDCIFDTNCLPESSLHRRLELLSIDSSDIRVMRENNIRTIDDLADLDLTSPQARSIEANPTFTQNLEILRVKARARRSTLPRGNANPNDFPVQQLPYQGTGQLPSHDINGEPLIRIFLAVDYDYVEARIVALSAHVTSSSDEIETRANQNPTGSWTFDPTVYEVNRAGMAVPLGDTHIIRHMQNAWSKNYVNDSERELQLILNFFNDLVSRIREVANGRALAPIHFYVWSRQEITHLIEACSRVDTRLLGPLSELFGCRLPLDQLIFSCLHDEIQQRYALGWTSKGLSVVTSLSWYGKRYHWTRRVNNQNIWLEQIFTQDIFDFKTPLKFRDDQTWEEDLDAEGPNVRKHTFELRSRFNDSLSVPYWHATWETLPDRNRAGLNPLVIRAIDRYNRAAVPGYMLEFLKARILALRWLEERIRFKNEDIVKTPLEIDNLPRFNLGVTTTNHAATDFLRLENHIKRTDWIAAHLVPPKTRVSLGETIPISGIKKIGDRLFARIDLTGYGIDLNALQVSTTFSEGSFVRVSECNRDPTIGQRLYQLINNGWTCIIKNINWTTGDIELSYLTSPNESRYIVRSLVSANRLFVNATIDGSISDFVARRVDEHLSTYTTSPIYNWFDPQTPNIPPQIQISDIVLTQLRAVLANLVLSGVQHQLDNSQIEVILNGLNTRVQLVQGPPGTGKTVTTAIAILARILARRNSGDVILVSATTHTALDNLLSFLSTFLEPFNQISRNNGLQTPNITIAKVRSSEPEEADTLPPNIHTFEAQDAVINIEQYTENSVAIIGGTPSALLKMYRLLVVNDIDFSASELIVDEASMMVFPHFLAVASLISDQGTIMLTGDHRQLAPIISHDWENEDRPPVVVFKPYRSAYAVVKDMTMLNLSTESVLVSPLTVTYRLPPPLVDLISRLYRLDNIDLQCTRAITQPNSVAEGNVWQRIWRDDYGLFLVLHTERQSQRHNNVEADIIHHILNEGGQMPANSLAIVTPHRAQRRLLITQLADYFGRADAPIGVIDTVERLQGGQRPVVMLSAVESDPSYIGNNVSFILDLNRSNVAFSRAHDRLIVVCSENLINYIPTESDQYDATMLWKALRTVCSLQIGEETVQNERVQVFTYQP